MLKGFRLRLCVGAVTLFASQIVMAQEPPGYLRFDYSVLGDRNTPTTGNTLRTQSPYEPHACLDEVTNKDEVGGHTRVSCDFWWQNYVGPYVHTGADFQLGVPNNVHPYVSNVGFGQLCGLRVQGNHDSTAYASIEYLLDSGDIVKANYLHFENDSISPSLARSLEGNFTSECTTFVSKGQYIAREGNTGLEVNNSKYFPNCHTDSEGDPHTHIDHCNTHLHFEFSNPDGRLRRVPSLGACTGSNCVEFNRNKGFDLDGLKAYHEFVSGTGDNFGVTGNTVWYNPDKIFSEKKILLPTFIVESKYSVFGYATKELTANLQINRLNVDKRASINLSLLRNSFDRNDAFTNVNVGAMDPTDCDVNYNAPNDSNYFHFINNTCLRSGTLFESEKVPEGDYLVYPVVEKTPKKNIGYPIAISIIHESELIIDNDIFSSTDHTFSLDGSARKQPGYFLTSDKLDNSATARWTPNRKGLFSISVSASDNTLLGNQRYQVCPRGPDSCQHYNVEQSNGQTWLELHDSNGDVMFFDFNKSGYIELQQASNRGREVFADAVRLSYHSNEIVKLENQLSIPNGEGHRLIRHYMEDDLPSSIQLSNGTTVVGSLQSRSDGQYVRYTYNGRESYIKENTHRVVGESCVIDSAAWYRNEPLFLLGLGISFCEGE